MRPEDIAAVSSHQAVAPPATARPPAGYSRPDWQIITETILCPLCEYNLRGLSEPMCPECGYRFDWPDLLDPERRRNRWLFEHNPAHNVRSFFATLFRHFRPEQFWRGLHPNQPSRVGRLTIYWLICAVISLAPGLAIAGVHVSQWLQWRRSLPPGVFPAGQSLLLQLWHDSSIRGLVVLCALTALFPWLNLLALLIFQQSMGRAKVKAHHVLRCAIYSGDGILWAGVLGSGAVAYWFARGSGWPGWGGWGFHAATELEAAFFAIACLVLLLNFAGLVYAYRNYLKFDHVYATVIAEQVVVLLAVLAVFMDVMVYL